MAITLEKRSSSGPILVILLFLAIGVAVYFFMSWQSAIKVRDNLSVQVTRLGDEKERIVLELSKTQSDLAAQEEKLEKLTNELSEAKRASHETEFELKKKAEELAAMQMNYEKRINELGEEVKRYADFNATLEKALQPFRGAGGLQTAAVPIAVPVSTQTEGQLSQEGSVASSFDLTAGQVLSINREYGFVISNIGARNGAKPGSMLQLYRHNEPLGLVRIERVQNDISAASIVSEALRDRIEEGDRVVLVS